VNGLGPTGSFPVRVRLIARLLRAGLPQSIPDPAQFPHFDVFINVFLPFMIFWTLHITERFYAFPCPASRRDACRISCNKSDLTFLNLSHTLSCTRWIGNLCFIESSVGDPPVYLDDKARPPPRGGRDSFEIFSAQLSQPGRGPDKT